MHRSCRAISVLNGRCGCRSLSTASAVQLKPKSQNPITKPLSSDDQGDKRLPTAKSWARPPQRQAPSSPEPTIRKPSSRSWAPLSQPQTSYPSPLIEQDAIRVHDSQATTSQSSEPSLASVSEKQTLSEPMTERSTAKNMSPPVQSGSSPALNSATGQDPLFITHQSSPHSLKQGKTRHPTPSLTTSSFRDTRRPTPPVALSTTTQDRRINEREIKPVTSKGRQDLGSQNLGFQRLQNGRSATLKNRRTRPNHSQRLRKKVFIPSTLTVASLASILRVKLGYLLNTMKRVGMKEEASYDYILNSDYAVLLADELNFIPVVNDEAAFDIYPPPPHPNPSSLPSRPPIVTIMGHVDHGKTTLLDTLRSASVAKGEAGGITQHIGAFSVPVKTGQSLSTADGQSITFLDTPGHAAFSAMRARGADVTDIVVLVVAADDGIMPQTREVINLLKRDDSELNLVVAINKIDKPGADTDAVKKALMAEGVQLEDFGGDVPSIHVSGLTGEGLPELVETLSAVAEMQDLRAEQDGPVFGHVLESNFYKGLGPVATVLIQRGCLKLGSQLICGITQGKVRRMTDSNGISVKNAIPGMAVTVSGWKALPKAGDEVMEGSDADIKKALQNRVRKEEEESKQQDVDVINASRRQDRIARAAGPDALPVENTTSGPKVLKLIIKADVSGSGEALEGALDAMGNSVAVSKVISTSVGDVTESDIMLAKAANATIVGFSVSAPRSVSNLAVQNDVPLVTSDIIYRLVDAIRAKLIDLLPKIIETTVVGEANVQQLFDIQLQGGKTLKVAGCRVANGLIEKQKSARVVRAGKIIHEGSLETMRQLKKDITEARKGLECGISFTQFADLREGDLIQTYETIEKPGIL